MWSGEADAALLGWMYDKAGLPGDTPATEPPRDLRLAIDDLRPDEAPTERQAGGPPVVKHLRAEVDFQLSGPTAYLAAAHQWRYAIQILACDLNTCRTRVLAADQAKLRPETLTYTAAVECNLPETGNYQLLATILFPDDGAVSVTRGPMLSVIP